MATTPRLRTRIRQLVGVQSTNVPVIEIPGDSPPTLTGTRGGHFTKGGRRIDHPSAYSKQGWSNMVYHRSTLQITVGEQWLNQFTTALTQKVTHAN